MVLERLEALPVGRFHYKLLLVTGLGWLFDSMDTGLIAFILPVLAKEWGLAPGQMGLIGSIGLIGMALGAVISGTVADRIGRKKVFTITVLLYSIASAFCALSWNYQSLLVFRFLVGFGLGGELPVAATLVSEYAPSRVRGRFIVLLESFWGLGWIAAACIAYFFIPVYGWRMAFLIGALPALYVCLIRLHMPESVRYLLTRGRVDEARQIVLSLEKQLHVPSALFTGETEPVPVVAKASFRELWKKPFMSRTIMLWLVWFGINFSYYGIFMWLPSLVFQQGFTVVKTFEYVLIMTLAQLPGYYCAAWLVDKIGRKYTLSAFLLFSGVASYFFRPCLDGCDPHDVGFRHVFLQPRCLGRPLYIYAGTVSDGHPCLGKRLGCRFWPFWRHGGAYDGRGPAGPELRFRQRLLYVCPGLCGRCRHRPEPGCRKQAEGPGKPQRRTGQSQVGSHRKNVKKLSNLLDSFFFQ